MNVSVKIDESVFYKTVGEENGISINSESELFNLLCSLLKEKRKVETINKALSNAGLSGYGIIFPARSDFELESPMMIAENGRFGIRLKCVAHASHIIKSDISAEISPMIGSEAECSAFYEKILNLYESDPEKIWETEFFGRSVSDMMADSIVSKLTGINEETKNRLTKAVGKISNSSKGGLYIFWI